MVDEDHDYELRRNFSSFKRLKQKTCTLIIFANYFYISYP